MNDLPHDALRLGPISELAEGTSRGILVGDDEIAVHHLDGRVYVTSGLCHHQQAPLAEGTLTSIDGVPIVTCPWHGWQYRVDDGSRIDSIGTPLTTHQLTVREGWVFCLDKL